MGTLVISLIGFFVLSFLLRILRRSFQFIDWIAYLLVIGGFVWVWITEGFLWGIFSGVITSVIVNLMIGIGNKTEIRRFGRKYSFECEHCGLGDLDIVQDSGESVTLKCPRCGKVVTYILNH